MFPLLSILWVWRWCRQCCLAEHKSPGVNNNTITLIIAVIHWLTISGAQPSLISLVKPVLFLLRQVKVTPVSFLLYITIGMLRCFWHDLHCNVAALVLLNCGSFCRNWGNYWGLDQIYIWSFKLPVYSCI